MSYMAIAKETERRANHVTFIAEPDGGLYREPIQNLTCRVTWIYEHKRSDIRSKFRSLIIGSSEFSTGLGPLVPFVQEVSNSLSAENGQCGRVKWVLRDGNKNAIRSIANKTFQRHPDRFRRPFRTVDLVNACRQAVSVGQERCNIGANTFVTLAVRIRPDATWHRVQQRPSSIDRIGWEYPAGYEVWVHAHREDLANVGQRLLTMHGLRVPDIAGDDALERQRLIAISQALRKNSGTSSDFAADGVPRSNDVAIERFNRQSQGACSGPGRHAKQLQ